VIAASIALTNKLPLGEPAKAKGMLSTKGGLCGVDPGFELKSSWIGGPKVFEANGHGEF
jgi:hypothetical protein